MKAAMKKRKAHTAEHTYVHRILSSDRRSLHYYVLWFIINTLTQFLHMIPSSTKYMTFTESFSVCQNGIRLTWLDCKLLFLITQLSQSLFEAGAIGFHEGGEEKPEWPSQDFTKNWQLAIHLPSIHGPLSLLVHKRFYNDLQGFHKFTRI